MQTIKFNEKAIFDFDLSVKNELGETLDLTFSEKESKENLYIYNFESSLYNAKIEVEVVKKENSAYLRLKGEMSRPFAWEKRRHFAPYNSIMLKLKPKKDADKIFCSYFNCGEDSDCWVAPHFCDSFSKIKRSVSILWENEDTYFHMMPLCDGDFKGEIKNIDNCMTITASPFCGGFRKIDCKAVILTWGENPYEVCEKNVEFGFDVLEKRNTMRKNTRLAENFKYLGWCSWDSMATNVSSEKFYKKAQEFKDKNIPVKWMLVDYGWYTVVNEENNNMSGDEIIDFREDKEKFPEGLKEFVSKMKNEYGMKYMGIWEASLGGWSGVNKNSPLLTKVGDKLTKLPNGMIIPKPDEMSCFGFWNYVNEYLSNCGFDFLKVDVEYSVEAATNGYTSVGSAVKNSHHGMEGSVGLHFDGACINCTGMGHELLWNSPVGMINRNSGDFVPNKPETMRGFVTMNVYNSFYHSQFYYTDWDMMWSKSETAKMNIVMHAISGAPVYLSDPLGISERENIIPLCLDDGQLLKCDSFAVPTKDRLFVDPLTQNVSLKAFNTINESGVIGVINVDKQGRTINDTFKVSDIHNIKGDKFVVLDWYNKAAKISCQDDEHKFELIPYDAQLYIISPIVDNLAIIGNIDKFISPAIVDTRIDNGNSHIFILKQGGKFAFYTDKDFEVYVNNEKAEASKQDIYYVVDCESIRDKVSLTIKIK